MNSIWEKDYINKNLESINKNMDTPVLIIGGGIAGLMCAYSFMKNNIKFILVDKNKLASKVSLKTTAQVSIAHDNLYDEILKKHGYKKAVNYLKLQLEGLELINEIIKKEKIECDYKVEDTILYANSKKNIEVLEKQYNLIKKHYNVSLINFNDNVMKFKKGLVFHNQFIFNPVKYMMNIIDILINNDIKLYENSTVNKIVKIKDNYEVLINDKYKVTTNKIVMACHYPILNPDNLYFAKIYQSKSYVIAFNSDLYLSKNYVSLDEPFYYLRTYDGSTLILGGSDHYTGKKSKFGYNQLIKKMYQLDKNATIKYKWFTEDCMPIDSLPFVGKYSNKNPNIVLVTGFQKWGFTNSHIASKVVTNIILNNEENLLFKTNRFTLTKDLNSTFKMIKNSLDGLVISKLFVKKIDLDKIKINSGVAINYHNKNVLVYRESKEKYIFLENKCTHMGCTLIWDDNDKVWCSRCHGSIYDRYGKVIYGPAITDLKQIHF